MYVIIDVQTLLVVIDVTVIRGLNWILQIEHPAYVSNVAIIVGTIYIIYIV